jgi:hypothetical protein
MTVVEILAQRLVNQRLVLSDFSIPAQVVAWLGAVQSQDYYGAKWAVAQRAVGITSAAVEAAFNAGEILRTHVMRPTWHFVVPQDIHWLLQLTASRVKIAHGSNFRKYEVDDVLGKRIRRILTRVLQGGNHLTRSSLRKLIARTGVNVSDSTRFGHMLLRAELDGVICSGPRDGNQFTYALLEERVPKGPAVTRDESLAELTSRYFNSHGPATINDFAWWSGLTVTDVKRGLGIVGNTLVQSVFGEKVYYSAKQNRELDFTRAHLLPAFDEYLVAYRDRRGLTDSFSTRESSWLGPAILLEGRVVGSWQRHLNRDELNIELKPFVALTRKQRALVDTAAEEYRLFWTGTSV